MLTLFAQRANFVQRFAGLLGDIVDVGGEECGGLGECSKVVARAGDSALSCYEFDAPSLTNFFRFAQQDATDLAGLIHMRPAAGAEIEVANVDDAEFVTVSDRNFSQAEHPCLFASDEANFNWAVLENDFVGEALGFFDLRSRERGRIEIDGAVVVCHVEGNGVQVETADEGRRENVLSRMLLHVIAAPGGVDLAVNPGSGLDFSWGGFEVVDDAAVFTVGNFGNFEFLVFGGDDAGVEDLATTGGIEGGPVEEKSWLGIRLQFAYFSFEVVEK